MSKLICFVSFAVAFLGCSIFPSESLPMFVFSIGLLATFISLLRTAIRNGSFGVFGFSDLFLRKPKAARADQIEVVLFSLGLGVIAGVFLFIVYSVLEQK